jgi:hypothetical protein
MYSSKEPRPAGPKQHGVTDADARSFPAGHDVPAATAQLRQLASLLNSSPRAAAQRRVVDSLNKRRTAPLQARAAPAAAAPVQRVIQLAKLVKDRLNVAGETHPESDARRGRERQIAATKTGSPNYWQEGEFTIQGKPEQPADPYQLRFEYLLKLGLALQIDTLAGMKKAKYLADLGLGDLGVLESVETAMNEFRGDDLERLGMKINIFGEPTRRAFWVGGLRRVVLRHCIKAKEVVTALTRECTTKSDGFESLDISKLEHLVAYSKPLNFSLDQIIEGLDELSKALHKADTDFGLSGRNVSRERSVAMHDAAQEQAGLRGVWKVGEAHATDMETMARKYNLLSKTDFDAELKD